MPQPEPEFVEVYVQPGESRLVKGPATMRTLLGSCVGITFRVHRLAVGALCHPMLPRCPKAIEEGANVREGRRYVDFAIREMARQLDALGAKRAEVEVKIFGGGDVLTSSQSPHRPTVGRLNIDSAVETLDHEGFAVRASRLGGDTGVNIEFSTVTGEVLVKRLAKTSAATHPRRRVHRSGPVEYVKKGRK